MNIWLVMTRYKRTVFRAPSYDIALRFAIRKVEIGQFKNLYIISKKDFEEGKFEKAERISARKEVR